MSINYNKNTPVYKMWWFWVVIVGTFSIWSQIFLSNALNTNNDITVAQIIECKENAIYIEYKDLMRYPDKYYGTYIVYTGEVLQVIEKSSNKYILRIAIDSNYNKIIIAKVKISENAPLILEDDIITIYGKTQGNYKYTAILGNRITVPYIEVMIYQRQNN